MKEQLKKEDIGKDKEAKNEEDKKNYKLKARTGFRIPFTVKDLETLKSRSAYFLRFVKPNPASKIKQYLSNAEVNITREEYIAICIKTAVICFISFIILFTAILYFVKIDFFYLYSTLLAILFTFFVFSLQIVYPKLYDSRREKNIERNLIAALQDMLVQLNAGVPLFNIIVNISNSDYEELSSEFKKAVKKINGGIPQLKVLEELGEKNSSIYFRRTLWQISNGMRAGSDIAIVIKESIHSLTEEQIIQIQTYGNKLNPMIMFYMLMAVIMPALSITFLTVISSLVSLSSVATIFMFSAIFVVVLIAQIIFVGVIKSMKPTLM